MERFKSFDVFDTCLIRLCGAPEKVFDIMSKCLFSDSQVHLQKAFLAERERIERDVFKINPNANISQLYDEFNESSFGISKNDLINLEMAVQEELLYPNGQMLKQVQEARMSGAKIAFVSDMYLPSLLIKKVLEKYGFYKDGDIIAVSCEWNASKYEGSLFDKILDFTGSTPKQWVHCGDNPWADYEMPRKKGLNAWLYKKGGFTSDELEWLRESTYSASKFAIDRFCGICRAVRLNLPDGIEYTLAVDFVASIYVPYIYQVLQESHKKGIQRLYFIGRDGRIFLRIAEQFQSRFPDIELKYIKFSRKAIYPCSFYNADENELEWFFRYSKSQTLSNALSYLGIEWKEMSLMWRQSFSEDLVLNDANIPKIIKVFAENDSTLLRQKSSQKRNVFLDYLRQEGVFDRKNHAFVDLGWVGTTRVCINKILKKEGLNPFFVFYFGATNKYMVGGEKDDAFIFLKQGFVYSGLTMTLLEHYASMNEDGSVLSYESNGECINPIEAESMFWGNKLVSINELAVKKISQLYADLDLSEDENYNVFLCCGLRKMNSIEETPSLLEYKMISSLQSEDFGVISNFVKKYSLKDIFALLVWGVPSQSYWDAGARIKTFGKYSRFFEKIFKITSSFTLSAKLRYWWERKK